MAKKTEGAAEIQIVQVQRGRVEFCVVGMMPIILNRMSEKAMHELLMPKGKKTAADKASSLKHDPYAEFVASPYTDPDESAPTLIQHLASAFKGAMVGCVRHVPGVNMKEIGQLCWVEGERISIYGVPQMLMSVVRSADMNKTPDIRTRAIIPKWACRISVTFTKPMLNETSIANLLVSAGITQGTGDWRNEKGKGTYGQFELVAQDHPEFLSIIKTGGRKAQVAAMEDPAFYDRETEELYRWFQEEIGRRGKSEMIASRNGKALAATENGAMGSKEARAAIRKSRTKTRAKA